MTGTRDFLFSKTTILTLGVHLPPTEEKLRTFPQGNSVCVTTLTTHLRLLEEYLVQRSVENTYSQ